VGSGRQVGIGSGLSVSGNHKKLGQIAECINVMPGMQGFVLITANDEGNGDAGVLGMKMPHGVSGKTGAVLGVIIGYGHGGPLGGCMLDHGESMMKGGFTGRTVRGVCRREHNNVTKVGE